MRGLQNIKLNKGWLCNTFDTCERRGQIPQPQSTDFNNYSLFPFTTLYPINPLAPIQCCRIVVIDLTKQHTTSRSGRWALGIRVWVWVGGGGEAEIRFVPKKMGFKMTMCQQ